MKRRFAIVVEDYNEKKVLLGDIFSKSRVPNTELFALDINLVIQLLSSFNGEKIYPETKTKERQLKLDWDFIPNGEYYLSEYKSSFGEIKATMRVQDGVFTVLKGIICMPTKEIWLPESRKTAQIENNILMENIDCNSPSTAGWVPLGSSNNGWLVWKNKEGQPIDIYRN